MKAIVVGCGRIGAFLALRLEEEGHDVVVVDNNSQSFLRVEGFKGKAVLGDGADIDVLKAAGIKKADMFASVTNRDNINLMSAQIARAIFDVKRVTCLVYCPRRASIYRDLGLDTVNISQICSRILLDSMLEARTVRRYQLGDGSGIALEIKLNQEWDTKTIKDLNISGEFKISSVIRGLNVIVPDDDFILKTDDHIFGVVLTSKLKKLENKLGLVDDKDNEEKLSIPEGEVVK